MNFPENFNPHTTCNVRRNTETTQELLDEYQDLIYAVIYMNAGNDVEPEDVFQDFVLSLLHRPLPATVENRKSYICRALKNDIFDATRKTRSHRARIVRYIQLNEYRLPQDNPLSVIVQTEESRNLLALVEENLPRHEAQAVTERHFYGKTTEEVAERMGVANRTLSRYVCTGLRKLRQVIQVVDD